jgi:hypothetical protein
MFFIHLDLPLNLISVSTVYRNAITNGDIGQDVGAVRDSDAPTIPTRGTLVHHLNVRDIPHCSNQSSEHVSWKLFMWTVDLVLSTLKVHVKSEKSEESVSIEIGQFASRLSRIRDAIASNLLLQKELKLFCNVVKEWGATV